MDSWGFLTFCTLVGWIIGGGMGAGIGVFIAFLLAAICE